jgi:hypothetical protein
MDSDELREQLAPELLNKKFDCDDCGATVDGAYLKIHSNWHERVEALEEFSTVASRAIANLANPDRIKK